MKPAHLFKLLLLALIIGFVWCVFYFVINETPIYSLVQKAPYLAVHIQKLLFLLDL